MHAKGDVELNRNGSGETKTAEMSPCDSDSCATSAHRNGEKQNSPASPAFPANPHLTMPVPTVLYFSW